MHYKSPTKSGILFAGNFLYIFFLSLHEKPTKEQERCPMLLRRIWQKGIGNMAQGLRSVEKPAKNKEFSFALESISCNTLFSDKGVLGSSQVFRPGLNAPSWGPNLGPVVSPQAACLLPPPPQETEKRTYIHVMGLVTLSTVTFSRIWVFQQGK